MIDCVGGGRTLMLDEDLKTYEVPKFRYVFLKNGNVRETIDADSDEKAFSQISKFGYHISMFDGCIKYDKTGKNYTIVTF